MEDLKAYTLFSGSSGNSVYIKYGSTAILIDAGVSAKALLGALNEIGEDVGGLCGIFVTHEHSDHIKGIPVLSSKLDVPIHIVKESYEAAGFDELSGNFVLHLPSFEQECGELKISSFVTPHDSRMSVGYTVDTPCGKIGIATDMGYMMRGVYEKIRQCRYVVLESNYDEKMLMGGPYPQYLKRRIFSKAGHLSNDECALTVQHLAAEGTEKVLLAHLSRENNTPELALDCSQRALSQKNLKMELSAADRSRPTKFI